MNTAYFLLIIFLKNHHFALIAAKASAGRSIFLQDVGIFAFGKSFSEKGVMISRPRHRK